MNTLEAINKFTKKDAEKIFLQCCGAVKWVDKMISARPFKTELEIFQKAETNWYSLDEADWLEAFEHHPRIGDLNSLKKKFSTSKNMAEKEQSGVNDASLAVLKELAKLNDEYLKKFGYIFIVCATGKSAVEMLAIIKNRINHESGDEIKIAMEEQNKITKLRLEKLL